VSLDARLRVARAGFTLDVELGVDAGETVAVLGPNGSGKTTLLHALAGLVPLDAGRVTLDGLVLDDVAAAVTVPTEGRPVAVVFQDLLLFPHLSALENVAFGLRCRGQSARAARAAARARSSRSASSSSSSSVEVCSTSRCSGETDAARRSLTGASASATDCPAGRCRSAASFMSSR